MRVQLLTVLAVCSCLSAALVFTLTTWIATTRRWRDHRVIALHMLTGLLCSVGLAIPTVVGVPTRVLLLSSSWMFAAGALHYHAWLRVLAYVEGRALRPWAYAPVAL